MDLGNKEGVGTLGDKGVLTKKNYFFSKWRVC